MVLYPVAVLLLGLGLWHIGRVRWCVFQPHLVFAAVVIGSVTAMGVSYVGYSRFAFRPR